MFYHMLAFIRYIKVYFTFARFDCVRYNEDFLKSRFLHTFYCNFVQAKENRSLYRGLRNTEVR